MKLVWSVVISALVLAFTHFFLHWLLPMLGMRSDAVPFVISIYLILYYLFARYTFDKGKV